VSTPTNPSTTRTAGRGHLRVVRTDGAHRNDGVLRHTAIGPLDLELGGYLDDVTVAWRSWGQLNERGDNAVIVLHALTGDSNAGGEGGWWEPVIGPGKPLDTDTHFVLCSNILGGCQGTTGPASIDPTTGRAWGMHFPLITIGDIVAAQRRLVEALGITAVIPIGGSIGGFQALEWATRHNDLVRGSAVIAASGALGAQGIALHGEVGRRAIMSDPAWHNGDYAAHGAFPEQGLAIARMAAMVTYHSRESLGARFGRTPASRPVLYPGIGPTFDVEGYLHYHGQALVQRFDANSYLYLSRAMDMYDVARSGDEETWLRHVDTPILLVGISSDWLFPPDDIRTLTANLQRLGADATYREIDSPNGHDSFLKDWDQLNGIVAPFVERIASDAPGAAGERSS
jgi:homoserine O-acetyltransferase/O-succinyltransferase